MRIRITASGIYGNSGEIPVGTEFDVSHSPEGWDGRFEIVSDAPDAPLTADTAPVVTMPTPAIADLDKPALVEMLDAAGVEYDKRLGVEKLRELAAGL